MSVINCMLKDLDKRQQSHDLENLNVAPVQYQAKPVSKLPWILLAIVSVLLLYGIANSWQAWSNSQVEQVKVVAVGRPSSSNLNLVDSDVKPVGPLAAENITKPAIQPDTATKSTSVLVTPVAPKPSSMAVTEVHVSNEQLALRRYRLATEAENRGLLSDAIVYYGEALALTPVMHKARRKLAALYYGKGRLDSASNILIKGMALFPEEYAYLFLLARVQQASGDIQLAMSSLEQIPDESLLAKQKWTMQSSLAQKSENYQLAEESYRKLLRIEAGQARWWMGLGYALDSQLEYDSAKQAYRQALSVDGLSKQANAYIENRLVQLGESE
ncbi:putative MSHA biogenesis protein MshN [Shewanella benthica]|uniref:Putative MSHA biogenesis protein MshN n=1 Tax=Shewanella benthica TaxID=43661 RepID=A0A330M588_9GAMM|nr:tetratricopeptide repeat protein [Shewanella benthica]SQH74907.1 putative MSHA biogenesis protein MshN [Shewanella benthica]